MEHCTIEELEGWDLQFLHESKNAQTNEWRGADKGIYLKRAYDRKHDQRLQEH